MPFDAMKMLAGRRLSEFAFAAQRQRVAVQIECQFLRGSCPAIRRKAQFRCSVSATSTGGAHRWALPGAAFF